MQLRLNLVAGQFAQGVAAGFPGQRAQGREAGAEHVRSRNGEMGHRGRCGRVALRLQALKDLLKGQRISRIAKGSEIAGKSLNPLLVILVLALVVSQFVEELIQIDARDGTAALAGVVGPAKLDRR